LRCAGVELYLWSPLRDGPWPPEIGGLIIGGGYPELWAAALSERRQLLQDMRQRIAKGLPVYAECGGLMFLGERLITADGKPWPLVGALPLVTRMTQRLTLGYRRVVATQDTCFVRRGQAFTGHEFHYPRWFMANPSPFMPWRRCMRLISTAIGGVTPHRCNGF